MDQVKQFLWQVAKYRFWISVCIATLFSAGAYVLGSGPVQKETEAETGKITAAYKDVQQYASTSVPTADFTPIVEEKTKVLTRDVDAAWKQLYDRQAPLLTWPETVSERFKKWGRKWPEDVAPSAVQLAIIDYVQAYPDYVEQVFKTFRPFNYETGEGVVASAPKEQLLRPTKFDDVKPPKLGEVWASQERLWVQRTALEVIAQVNRNAKDWNSAYIKEVKALEVGSPLAQDQRSLAKGETLEEAESIKAPNEPDEEEAGAGGEMSPDMGMMPGGMGSGMMGSGMMPGMGAAGAAAESIFYLKPENATQYKILPIMLTVLIDQSHIQDLMVEFENSPMSIEVRDFEMLRPTEKIVKPEKGEMFMGGYGMYGMGMMPGMMPGGRMGYGGMSSAMMNRGRMMEGMMDSGMMPGGMGMSSGMMPGMMGPGMGMGPQRKGVDKRAENRAEKRKETAKALEASKPTSTFDANYNIVEVTIYGQARFYNEPTPAEAAPESPGEAPAEAPADAPKAEEPKAEGTEPAAPADAPKAEEPKPEGTAPAPGDAPAAPPADMPKDEAAPAPAETPKADPAAPPAEAPKAEEPKPDAPKPEGAEAAPAPAPAPANP